LIGAEDEGFENGWVGAVGGEFHTAEGVEAGFESGDAQEAPFGIGDGLGEVFLTVAGGAEFPIDERDEGLVGRDVIRWQEDRAAS